MKKILIDTNFLLIPTQFKVDIFSEIERICIFNYELFILDKTIEELKNIIIHTKIKDFRCPENSKNFRGSQKGKNKAAAKLALKLIAIKKIKTIKTEKNIHTDTEIVNTANKDFIVATQDKELKRRLKEKNIPIITLRQKKYLILT